MQLHYNLVKFVTHQAHLGQKISSKSQATDQNMTFTLPWADRKPKKLDLSLSPGQTDSQGVASSHKFDLRTDLRWVAKRTRKFPRKHTKLQKKNISR